MGKESTCNVRDTGDKGLIPGLGRFPWRRSWQPTLVFLPEESHGQRSLVGYSPWGHKESDTTEQLHFTMALVWLPRSVVKRISLLMQETPVPSLGWEDSPGEGNGNPLQYSCLGNPMDKGAWWAAVPEITESQK